MSKSNLYWCLVEGRTESEAFIQSYWTHAEHIGVALEKITDAARNIGVGNPEPREIDPYSIDDLQTKVIPNTSADVFWSKGRDFFPPEPIFRVPYGVIGACVKGEFDIDDIRAGFKRYRDDNGMTTFEVNVKRDDLLSFYEHLLRIHPIYKVFWYLLHSHWDDTSERFLVNKSFNTPDSIISHIRNNKEDSLLNGYVTLTSYLEEGATNLKISDHKRIIVQTYSDEVARAYVNALRSANYPESPDLVSIDYKIHHWHYRPPASRSRDELVGHLLQSGFSDWDATKRS